LDIIVTPLITALPVISYSYRGEAAKLPVESRARMLTEIPVVAPMQLKAMQRVRDDSPVNAR
jgi:hypothetical protein